MVVRTVSVSVSWRRRGWCTTALSRSMYTGFAVPRKRRSSLFKLALLPYGGLEEVYVSCASLLALDLKGQPLVVLQYLSLVELLKRPHQSPKGHWPTANLVPSN